MADAHLCWLKSYTGHYSVCDLLQLQFATAHTLIEVLKSEQPINVLTALVELLEHGQFDKLRKIGTNEVISQKWHKVEVEMLSLEAWYKFLLEMFFDEINPEPFG